MAKARAFTAIAILTLTIGIAANVTIFTVVNAVLLKSLPYKDPDRLIAIEESIPSQNLDSAEISYPNYVDWRKSIKVIQDVAVFTKSNVTIVSPDGRGERVSGARVSPNTFSVLGIAPAQGRDFLVEEGPPNKADVALISDLLWHNRFSSDPQIVGKTIKINGNVTTIVGVMPPRFRFPETADIWLPVEARTQRGSHYLNAVARMGPGTTIEQAGAEMESIESQLKQAYPRENALFRIHVVSLKNLYNRETGPVLFALLGAVLFVLLIAVANVANLLLSRSTVRQREMALRAALGAGRGRIIRQLLTESLLLSFAGGAIGYLISLWAVDALVRAIPEELPFFINFAIDARVVGFAFAVSLVTGILFGLAPAFASSKPNLNETLKETSPQSSVGRRQTIRSFLITAEVALALVLLIGSGLMIESFFNIRRVQPGFDRNNVLVMNLSLTAANYKNAGSRAAFHRQALDRFSALPGVEVASGTSALPLSGSADGTGISVEGKEVTDPKDIAIANEQFIAPGYFRSMRIPLLTGRDFNDADNEKSQKVVIVDEALAKQYWPSEDPVGKRLKFGGPQSPEPWNIIVGVVGNIRQYGLKEASRPTVYISYQQNIPAYFTYVVRTAGSPQSLAGPAREALQSLDPEQPLYDVRTLDEVVRASYWDDRFFSDLFAIFASIALMLASVGIYGIVSYAVNQRVHEIGIRMALGARTADVLRLVVGQGMRPVFVGVAIGIVAALGVTKAISSLFFGVNAWDPIMFASLSALLLIVSIGASYIPARRATRVDPVIALRHE